jgi:hypothetical protein
MFQISPSFMISLWKTAIADPTLPAGIMMQTDHCGAMQVTVRVTFVPYRNSAGSMIRCAPTSASSFLGFHFPPTPREPHVCHRSLCTDA